MWKIKIGLSRRGKAHKVSYSASEKVRWNFKRQRSMDRAICEAQLKDRKIVKYLMRMLDLNEAIDRLINANIVR